MNFKNMKVPNIPGGGASSALLKLGIVGGLALYAADNSLYNVEGGHRAIIFNRIIGVKDKVIVWHLIVFFHTHKKKSRYFYSLPPNNLENILYNCSNIR